MNGLSGNYEIDTTTGEAVRAFVPNPLPPDLPPDPSSKLARLHEQALLACGRLDAIGALLPEPDLFLYSYIRREAVLSSQIEGTQSSLSDLLLYELDGAPGVPFDDVEEVSGYVGALEHGIRRLQEGFPLCNRLLCEVHHRLLSHGRGADKQPGEFRRSQNWIGGTRPGNAHFVPPPPHRLPECMAALEKFLNEQEPSSSPLTRAALAHVQFETIHPFLDGNGRVGRLLISLMLHHEGVLARPLLYLSLYFKQHRTQYYQLLDAVRREGAWGEWLEFFYTGVVETATLAVSTARRLQALFHEDAVRLNAKGRGGATLARTFDLLRATPLVSIQNLTPRLGVSFPTASRAVEALVHLGILREITGRQRDRVFVYDRYLSILAEGTEPPFHPPNG